MKPIDSLLAELVKATIEPFNPRLRLAVTPSEYRALRDYMMQRDGCFSGRIRNVLLTVTTLGAALLIYISVVGSAWAQAGPSPYGQVQCNKSVNYDAATVGATELVPAIAGTIVYVCNYIIDSGSSTQHAGLVYGTGTNCATGTANLTPIWNLASNQSIIDNVADAVLQTSAGAALCINSDGAVVARVSYLQR